MGDLSEVRQKLEARLEELRTRVSKIQTDLRKPGNRDSQEHVTETENDEVLERLSEAELREIESIRIALQRIHSGIYGTCARCGGPIGDGRLRALPYATACIRCAG